MSLLNEHVAHYRDIFAIDGVLASPTLVFGFQDVVAHPISETPVEHVLRAVRHRAPRLLPERVLHTYLERRSRRHPMPADFDFPDLPSLLRARGVDDITVLDLFDPRADLRLDMNEPVPAELHGRFLSLIDIGSVEHVFDTRTCLESCMRMVRVGGCYTIHTPVRGYFDHGLHTFAPEAILGALTENGFRLELVRFTTAAGRTVDSPNAGGDVALWAVARKEREMDTFRPPQQGVWADAYTSSTTIRGHG